MSAGLSAKKVNEPIILLAILLLALANGLLYIFIVPPWQHYDEPNHFEYVWLLADRRTLPAAGDYDTGMRQRVARSMLDHHFFDNLSDRPDLTAEKPWIGQFPQLDEPPLYYLLASLPLQILPTENITTQLYAARLISLTLFLVTILVGYGLTAALTPARHPLRFLVPLTMALLPAFVDLMTAVNNDVGAIAAFSLFLWASVRLIRNGPSGPNLLWVLAASALCVFTKRTVYLALPLLGMALLFAFLRGKFRRVAWGAVLIAGIAGLFAVFSWGDAALWYRQTPQKSPTRISSAEIPAGETAFRLQIRPEDPPVKLVQIIPTEIAAPLSDQSLTLGAWIWASQPLESNTPQLQIYTGRQIYQATAVLTETPQFFAFNFTPNGDTSRAWVALQPGRLDLSSPVEIYYDGVVLAAGSYPLDAVPVFEPGGAAGTWGGLPFENLLRNASAELAGPYLRPWADQFASRFFTDYQGQESFSLTVYSLMDFPISVWYYQRVLTRLFRTFWAKFGWAHIPLLGGKPYNRILLPLTVLALFGVGFALWQQRQRIKKLPWDAIFFLSLSTGIVWGVTLLRGSTYLLTRIYFSVARYAYPAIIPTVLLLSTGWHTFLATLARWLRLPGWIKYAVYVGFFLGLNAYALLSIIAFYR